MNSTQVETPTLEVCQPTKTGVTLRSKAAIDVWKAVNARQPVVAKPKAVPLIRNCQRCGVSPVRVKFCSDACRQAAYREREAQYRATSAAYANLLEKKQDAKDTKFASANRHRAIGFDGRYSGVGYEFAGDVKIPTAAHLINDGLKPLWKERKTQE